MVYSRNVKKKFPKMYKGATLRRVVADIEVMSHRGRRGFSAKGGKECSNCTVPLQSRYPAIGNQNNGTTYHLVLVKIWSWVNKFVQGFNPKAVYL